MKNEVQSGYKPVQDDVLKTLGLALLAGQGVEQLMNSCLTYVLNDKPLQSQDELLVLRERHSKATLGKLLKVLQQRADINPTVNSQLERFLHHRNVIAHRLHDLPGGLDLHSDEGRARLQNFLLQYMDDGQKVSIVLIGLLRKWAQQEGIELPGDHHLSQRMLDQLNTSIVRNLDELIRGKGLGT